MSISGVIHSTPLWQQRTGVTPNQIALFCGRWGVCEFSLFGSVVREDFSPTSDVDVLVRLDPQKPHGGWNWVDMIEELQAMFGRKVDLTSPRILENPFRRKAILDDLQVIHTAHSCPELWKSRRSWGSSGFCAGSERFEHPQLDL